MITALRRYTESTVRGAMVTVIAALLLMACEQKAPGPKPPRLVYAMRVADASELAQRALPGRARAAKEVNLSFRVAGPLIAFPVKVGDEVKAGQVVARIDPQDYETALDTLKGQLEREQARRKRAQHDLTRLQRIRRADPGATSEAAIDRARQVLDSAAAGVRALQASVRNASDKLGYTRLQAPFGGVVVETYAENFETVVAKQPILRLLDPSSIKFVVNVPESLIGFSGYVKNVEVAFDALPGVTVPATIEEIGREASPVTRTYPVTLVMAQPEGTEILPGMAGQASVVSRLPDGSALGGIQIPATAVFSVDDPNKTFVWIVDESSKTLRRREVKIGGLAPSGVVITAGLEPGQWVVVKGVHSVAEGEVVRVLDAAKKEKRS